MKRFFLIAALVVVAFVASHEVFAALPSTLVWEIRSGGAAANGGGFNPSNANFPTDATATSATGNAPVISSATYTFVAGDVNAWVYIKAGTNWTPGWYKIDSVSAGAATVNATIGSAIQVTNGVYAPNTVAGVATTASPTGGTYGVDYSQQTGAELSITDAASAGSSTTLTSATAGFTPVMVGNLFHLTTTGVGGFGIIGWYEIVSYNSTSSVETDITTNNGTPLVAGTGAVGGAIATIGAIGSNTARLGAVAGNYVWINGSFTLTTTTDTFSCTGTSTSPVKIIGYGTKRGDGYLGRTAGAGLITTNMPTLTYTTGRVNANGAFQIVETLNLVGAPNAAIVTTASDSLVKSCVGTNSGTGASASVISVSTKGTAFDCDAFMTGASGGQTAILTSSTSRVIANRIKVVSTAPGILMTAANGVLLATKNTIYASGGPGISMQVTTGTLVAIDNTIVGCAGNGIDIITGTTGLSLIVGNLITDNTGFGVDLNSTAVAAFFAYNRTRDNSAAIDPLTGWQTATNFGAVTTDGAALSDYVSGATDDYRLIAASPATSASHPASASMGALQRVQTGGGGQTSSAHTK